MTEISSSASGAPDAARSSKASGRMLLRLVRSLLSGEAAYVSASADEFRLGGDAKPYPVAILRHAVSLGLVRHKGDRLSATPEARAFVRRALATQGEEAFAGQHRDMASATVVEDGVRRTVSRNMNESPLCALSRLRDREGGCFFPAEAIDAGERLLAEFTRAQLQPRVTASWEPRLSERASGGAGGMAEIAASALEARRRFGRAMDAMGPELSGVAADVCCFGKGLETVERERQWPARSAKLMLRTALLALARHYAPPLPPSRRNHHWGAEDFRPGAEAYGVSAG